jgi:rare lipoprotein A (peptidoglycan hydrolase)
MKDLSLGVFSVLTGLLLMAFAYRKEETLSSTEAISKQPIEERIPLTTPREKVLPREVLDPRKLKPMYVLTGEASFYGGDDGTHGRCMANGREYNKFSLVAAHRELPLGSIVRVIYNRRAVILPITDRGPYAKFSDGTLKEDRIIDLSEGAARALQVFPHGVGQVKIEVLYVPPEQRLHHWQNPKCLKHSDATESFASS